ncbi:MAG: type II toxin-antitoxin system death-on-curing family toxin [Clostridia bacterium]|nr:type II toxin-antitoxin system death-on-curing family toxin [Clostridia bacterium]
MILLTVDEILRLHRKLVKTTGGSEELRDISLLESAVYSTEAAFGGVELYPSVPEKAARLAYGLVSNHAFVDGNKRIGILAMLMTLRLNHISIQYTQAELIALGLQIASGEAQHDAILCWIDTHRS